MASNRIAKDSLKTSFPFLTSWDPTDLPGGSVDPLGFDRGYNTLADKILPGLTNVASHPRYLSLLCAGASLGSDSPSPSTDEIRQRREAILRLERYWALAQVLAAESGVLSAQGVRGVRYAEAQRDELARARSRSSGSRFLLLSRQVQYGCLGIYGNVASGMRLIDRKTLGLTPQFGDALGEAFIEETEVPRSVLTAVRDDAEVGLDVLRTWGERAHIAGLPRKREAAILSQALHHNQLRSRMADALAQTAAKPNETELDRLNRIARKLVKSDDDLAEAIAAISAYEKCYRIILLGFERLLWRCSGPGSLPLVDLAADDVLQDCAKAIPDASQDFEKIIDKAASPDFKRDLEERLKDVRAFLVQASAVSGGTCEFVQLVLGRHIDVQHGKFDRGRRKLPWLEIVDGVVRLTTARATLTNHEPRQVEDVLPHAYRTGAADALLRAAKGPS